MSAPEVLPVRLFEVGDRVRLLWYYGGHQVGEEFIVTDYRFHMPADTGIYTVRHVVTGAQITAFQHRFEKIEKKEEIVDEKNQYDPSEYIWTVVDIAEFDRHSEETPSRSTYFGGRTIFELGKLPVKLPTKTGAIIAPPPGNRAYKGWNPYVLSNDGEWYELMAEGIDDETPKDVVEEYLEKGWIIAFEGIDQNKED